MCRQFLMDDVLSLTRQFFLATGATWGPTTLSNTHSSAYKCNPLATTAGIFTVVIAMEGNW